MFRNNFLYRLRWRRCRPRCTACWRGRRLPSTYKERPPTRDGWYQTWPTALQLWCALKVQYNVWLNPDTVCFIYGIKSISQSAFDSNTTKMKLSPWYERETTKPNITKPDFVENMPEIFYIISDYKKKYDNELKLSMSDMSKFKLWILPLKVLRLL